MVERIYTPVVPRVDLTGKEYGDVLVLRILGRYKGQNYWLVQCGKCGKEWPCTHGNLQSNRVKQCFDCAKKYLQQFPPTTIHGYSGQRVHHTWMINKKRMCEKWCNSFMDFLEDMGEQPPDRYLCRTNNDPFNNENSYWGSKWGKLVDLDGVVATASEHAKLRGVSRQRIAQLVAKKNGFCITCFKKLDGKSKRCCKSCVRKERKHYLSKKIK